MPTRNREQSDTFDAERIDATSEMQRNNTIAIERASVLEEERSMAEKLASLRAQHEQVTQRLQEKTALLNQIQNSHGWRTLALYYKLRNRLVPRQLAKPLKQGVMFLLDMRLVSASGLFDKTWYLQQNPDVAGAGVPPLRHYLRRGGLEGRDPNPFFDSDWYLTTYPDLAEVGMNPLVHYLRYGVSEGRNPSPQFDTGWYLKQYPDVSRARMNPLSHYVLHGAAEGRAPNANFDANRATVPTEPSSGLRAQPYDVVTTRQPLEKRPKIRTRPIGNSINAKRSTTAPNRRRLICFTHVLPYPTRAGNEYRIHRMLEWLAANGFEIFLVVCPLPGRAITAERLASACSAYANLIVCDRDGTVLYQLADGDAAVKGLNGVRPREIDSLLAETKSATPIPPRLLPVVHTFCPDLLVEVVRHLDSVLRPEVVLAEYVLMTRPLPLLRRDAMRLVDTHDLFSTKHNKVVEFGIEDGLAMTPGEEAGLLAPADVVIAIQSEEAAELRRLSPEKPIVTAGIDFDPVGIRRPAVTGPVILMLGSDNSMNVKGLQDFIRFAWPLVRREVPDAIFHVVGSVGFSADTDDPSIRALGLVDNLDAPYAQARVVINPSVAGTGLKIKTVEALCHYCPLVTWPSGVEGLPADLRALCYVATDWYLFAQYVIQACKSNDCSQALLNKGDEILQRFSPDRIYAELGACLNGVRAVAG